MANISSRLLLILVYSFCILFLYESRKEQTERVQQVPYKTENLKKIAKSHNNPADYIKITSMVDSPQRNRYCPDGYTILPYTTDQIYCYFINEINRTCPYPPNVFFAEIRTIYKRIPNIGPIWAPLIRPYSVFIRHFRWLEPRQFLHTTDETIINHEDTNLNCVIYNGFILYAANCSSNYPQLCINKYDTTSNQCALTFQSDACFLGDFSGNSCYCITGGYLSRENFCDKLAEPIESYQSAILKKHIRWRKNSHCWIGLEKNRANYTWAWSNSSVNYFDWAPGAFRFGPFGAITPEGWVTTLDKHAFSCAICEKSIANINATITISFVKQWNKIRILVTHPQVIYMNEIHCIYGWNKFTVQYRHEVLLTPTSMIPELYWCAFFKFPTMELITSNSLFAYDINAYMHSFLVELQIRNYYNSTLNIDLPAATDQLTSMLIALFSDLTVHFKDITDVERSLVLYSIARIRSPSSYFTNSSIDDDLTIITNKINQNLDFFVKIIAITSYDVCRKSLVSAGDFNLTFPETPAGSWATSVELCLQSNYSPVLRKCNQDASKGAVWGEVQGTCSNQITISNATSRLHDLMDSNIVDNDINLEVNNITKIYKNKFKWVDVYFIARIFDKLCQFIASIDKQIFLDTINEVMLINSDDLAAAQYVLNSTDKILYNLDKLILESGFFNIASPQVLIHTIQIDEEVAGIMIIDDGASGNFTSFQLRKLFRSNYTEELLVSDFEVAVILSSILKSKQHQHIALFQNDKLFNQESNEALLGSWIINILLPDTNTAIQSIEIYFKALKNYTVSECVHWQYGNDADDIAIKGQWKVDSATVKLRDGFHVCQVNHTTHFGMLVSGLITEELANDPALNIITIFGAILSIFGVAIIFLTALIFRNWRNSPSNKIVLNVATSLLLLISSFYISSNIPAGTFCVIMGAVLHYALLAKFFWMLVICYSNYRRLVLGLHYYINNVVLKYCIFSWGSPIVIVLVILSMSTGTYNKNRSMDMCYPKGQYFKFGVLVPMGIMLTINLIIYIVIIVKITTTQADLRKHTKRRLYSTPKSIVLLFFLMGLTWVFGFISAFIEGVVFYYLFCLSSSLHGFIMFIYYIIDYTHTREMWAMKLWMFKRKQESKDTKNAVRSIEGESSTSQTNLKNQINTSTENIQSNYM